MLVSDANKAWRRFACAAGIADEYLHLRQHRRLPGACHVQDVNAYHTRFRGWLRHFNGSATRYLRVALAYFNSER